MRNRSKTFSLLIVILFLCNRLSATQWEVGPTRNYTSPSQVAGLVADGDTVDIDAGDYYGDVASWYAHDLVFRGRGGMAHLHATGNNAEGKAIWVIKGNNNVLELIEFSECVVPDDNGAGIRQEGTNLTIRYCKFHHNQMGLLAGDKPNSHILVEYSEFGYNGTGGGGYSHNIYVNHIGQFTFQYNYSHHSMDQGHLVKSRAPINYIMYNRLTCETGSISSYELDLPNGGVSYVIGNIIEQNADSANGGIISYGMEGLSNPINELYLINNTIHNNRPAATMVRIQSGTPVAVAINNIFSGPGTVINGVLTSDQNNLLTQGSEFENANGYDFSLAANSGAINAGIDPGQVNGVSLLAENEYRHLAHFIPRITNGIIDRGALEYQTDNEDYYCSLPQRSIQFTGSGTNQSNRIKIPLEPHNAVDIGMDMTIEFWMKCGAQDNMGTVQSGNDGEGWRTGNILVDRDVYGIGDYGDYGIAIGSSTGSAMGERVIAFGCDKNGQGVTIVGTQSVADQQWHHVAIVRDASTGVIRLYVDGVLDGSGTGPVGDLSYRDGRATNYILSDPYLVIGAEKHDLGLQNNTYSGMMEELRISNMQRYSADFLVSTFPYTVDAGTVLLLHFDEGNGPIAYNGDHTIEYFQNSGYINVSLDEMSPNWTLESPFNTNQVAIIGENNACHSTSYTYSVVDIAGTEWLWSVSGGSIVSGQGTATIVVVWDNNLTGNVSVIGQ